jgi:hypothetical protein
MRRRRQACDGKNGFRAKETHRASEQSTCAPYVHTGLQCEHRR